MLLVWAPSPATILVLAFSMWLHLPSMLHFDVAALAVSAHFTTSTLKLAIFVGLQLLLALLGPYPVTVPGFTGGTTKWAILASLVSRRSHFMG